MGQMLTMCSGLAGNLRSSVQSTPIAETASDAEAASAARAPSWYLATLLALVVPAILVGKPVGTLWMPAFGLGFTVLVLYGIRWLPVLLAIDLAGSAISDAPRSIWSFLTTAEFLLALAAGYSLAALAIRALGVDTSFRRLKDAVVLSAAGLVGAGVAAWASMGVLVLHYHVSSKTFWQMASYFAVGGSAGTFAIAPLLLILGSFLARHSSEEGLPTLRSVLSQNGRERVWASVTEIAVQAGVFGLAALLALRSDSSHSPVYYPLLIPICWIALRRGVGGASVAVTVGTCVVTAVAHADGLLASQINPLETFLTIFSVTGLCFGAAQSEHHEARRQLEANKHALTESEERMRLLVEGSTDLAIFMLDLYGNIVTWNAGAQKLNGYAPDEIIGRNVSVLRQAEGASEGCLDAELSEAATTGRFTEEGFRVRKDGSTYWAHVLLTPMRDPQGNLVGFSKVVQDITERRAAVEELTVLASTDELTGLANERSFRSRTWQAISRASKTGRPLGVIYLDLDCFKEINDTWHHTTGDGVLETVAQRLRKTLRATDVAARLHGDEFAVLCEDLPGEWELGAIAERIRAAIEDPMQIGDATFVTGASVGVAPHRPDDDVMALINRADEAMFEDKKGRSELRAEQRSGQRSVRRPERRLERKVG
jgi:diguanylate cyclase (GGDEF)-like protein/PAS domain S-box-containing protein